MFKRIWACLNAPIPGTEQLTARRLLALVELAWLLWLIAGCNFHQILFGV